MGEIGAFSVTLMVVAMGVLVLVPLDLGGRILKRLGPPKTRPHATALTQPRPLGRWRWWYAGMACLTAAVAILDLARHRTTGFDIFLALSSSFGAVLAFLDHRRGPPNRHPKTTSPSSTPGA